MSDVIPNHVLDTLHEIHAIGFHRLSGEGAFLYSAARELSENPFGLTLRQVLHEAMQDKRWGKVPVHIESCTMEQYLVLPYPGETGEALLLGPVLGMEVSMTAVDRLIAAHDWPLRHKPTLLRYLREVPQTEFRVLCKIGMLVWYLMRGERLDFLTLIAREGQFESGAMSQEVLMKAERAGLLNRKRQFHHHSTALEDLITESIRQGDKERLLGVMREYPLDGSPGILSRGDPTRSLKNSMICMITLATRAAISGGLHFEEAFTLSDQIILQMEEMSNSEDIMRLCVEMYAEMAVRVRDTASRGYSPAMEKCRAHLYRNLYMDVKLEDLVQLSGLNKNRLISKFREETGLTPHQWILRERVREAQRLLRTSDNSITDISIALNFHDVSHFTKTFKKMAGVSPLVWRKKEAGQSILLNQA